MLTQYKNSALWFCFFSVISVGAISNENNEKANIQKVVNAYIESQHTTNPELMASALHPKLAKRTYQRRHNGKQYLKETDYETMIYVAEYYNAKGDKFSKPPKKDIKILAVDGNIATARLLTDDWVDYMHLIKLNDQWKIVNAIWQYNDLSQHN